MRSAMYIDAKDYKALVERVITLFHEYQVLLDGHMAIYQKLLASGLFPNLPLELAAATKQVREKLEPAHQAAMAAVPQQLDRQEFDREMLKFLQRWNPAGPLQ